MKKNIPCKAMNPFLMAIMISFVMISQGNAQDLKGDYYTVLSGNFKDPPAQARPKVYWWWLNGWTDTSRMISEIHEMKKNGISGFDIFEIGVPARDTTIKAGPPFLSPESVRTIKLAVEEAGRLDMQAGLNMASSWNAGGSWIKSRHAAKSIYSSRVYLNETSSKTTVIPLPDLIDTSYVEEIAVIAVPADNICGGIDTSEVVNVTEKFNPETGLLEWVPGKGNWVVYRFVCSPSGEQLKLPSKYSAGPIIDHFDSTATEYHFMHVINTLKPVTGDFRKSALHSLYLASYEATGFVWTPSMPGEFRRLNGYEIFKMLPCLFDRELFIPEITDGFQNDFRRTLSELMIRNFYGKAKEIANKHGLKINSEAGGPGLPLHNVPVEPLRALGALDLPRGEFWINHSRYNEKGIDILRVVKEVSAASHIYNRGIVEEESFTSFQHWQEGPFDMKPFGDRAFCEGLSRVVIHGFSHNPEGTGYPGIVYHAGTHFNDKRVWWPKAKPFVDYLARISYIMQETGFFADVLYYYGDEIPNYAGHKNSRFTAGPGYDYEVINTEILQKLTVRNKKLITPGGSHFSLLAMEKCRKMTPSILRKINELVSQGAIIISPEPDSVYIPAGVSEDANELHRMADALWKDSRDPARDLKEGKVISGSPVQQILNLLKLPPDFDYTDKEYGTLDYIHSEQTGIDFYFIRNTTERWVTRTISFRQPGKSPEFWDPVTGKISTVSVFNSGDSKISMPVTLAPYESLFVVFRETVPVEHFTSISGSNRHPPLMHFTSSGLCILENGTFQLEYNDRKEVIENNIHVQVLDGAWSVSFQEGRGAPGQKILPKLISWTESEDNGIRYFSGTATYRKTFRYDPWLTPAAGLKIFLDPGRLSKVGEIRLNGKLLGITWCEPRLFEITDVIVPGENQLEIEISNTWSNRLTGDALTGENYTRTNISATNICGMNNTQVPWKEVPLLESGLLGPVDILRAKHINRPLE